MSGVLNINNFKKKKFSKELLNEVKLFKEVVEVINDKDLTDRPEELNMSEWIELLELRKTLGKFTNDYGEFLAKIIKESK